MAISNRASFTNGPLFHIVPEIGSLLRQIHFRPLSRVDRVCSDSLMRWVGIRVIGKGEMVFWIEEGRWWPWKTVVAVMIPRDFRAA